MNNERFPYTLLSLAEYAKIMGITPPHMWQGASATFFPDTCNGVWYSHDWQKNDRVSREQLAYAIQQAEEDIANVLGYYPAPVWISKEMHTYPKYHRRELYGNGRSIKGFYKSIALEYGKVIEAGRRAVTLLDEDATVTYSDPDGDGFNELATVTLANVTVTDVCEIKVYFADKDGEQEWEARPYKTKTLSSGTFTATFDSWLLIDPDLQEGMVNTNNPVNAIDITDSNSYVTVVDIYREYTDTTQASIEFSWQPKPYGSMLSFNCTTCNGTGCAACANTTQTGCFSIIDVETGIIVPAPATYSETDGQWNNAQWTECREPDTIKVWYYAGELNSKYLKGTSCNLLTNYFAQIIAYMATARLERNVCGCSNLTALYEDLRRDLAFSEPEGGFFNVTDNILNNPFGTRKGEVYAWQKLKNLVSIVPDMAIA